MKFRPTKTRAAFESLVPKAFVAALFLSLGTQRGAAEPPFSGTIFIDPNILVPSDRTAFEGLIDAGRGLRWMYDRRVNGWINANAFLFNVSFDDGLGIEVQVNPEFASTDAARAEAQKYAPVIGQLPTALRQDVKTVWIHQGTQPFGGGNNNLLIHTGQADLYAASGILEETLVHEASHTSLDAAHAASVGWLAAQVADAEFISTYARDNPSREDIAESFLPYLAVRYRSGRIPVVLADTISRTIPSRIAYFDSQAFDMYPISASPPLSITRAQYDRINNTLNVTWASEPSMTYRLLISSDLAGWQELDSSIPSGGTETTFAIDASGSMRYVRVRTP